MTTLTKEERLAKLRESLQANNTTKENAGQKTSSGDNASYPFWDIPTDSTAVIRFLPDADDNNPFFWVKREVIRLPFDGMINSDNDTTDEVVVTVPCMNMFGKTCPILSHTKSWWKTEKEDIARKYWKKISYLYQGFVVNDPLNETTKPENPIRRFVINKSIHDIIEKSLLDPDLDLPIDYQAGCDFRILKGKKGDYADYGASTWARKSRALSQEEIDSVDANGLFNLREYLGQEPSPEAIKIIEEMFLDSLNGEPYDMNKYGEYFKPYIANNKGGNSGQKSSAPKTTSNDRPVASTSKVSEPEANEEKEEPTTNGGQINTRALLDRIAADRRAKANG